MTTNIMLTTMLKMFLFEWRYFTRQPSFAITSLIFFSLAFATSLDQIGMTGFGNYYKNSPYIITQVLLYFGLFSLFLVANFITDTALRDHTSEMAEILYCKPVNPLAYQGGRFLGSFAVVLTVFAFMPLGMWLGSMMPWVNPSRFGPINLSHYLIPFFYLSVPSLFIFSCLLYSVAIRIKSTSAVYLTVVGVIILNEITENLFNAPDTRDLAALLDPFGWRAVNQITQYWSAVEKNQQLLSLDGLLLENRLLWLGLALVIAAVFGGFSRTLSLRKIKSKKTKSTTKTDKNQAKNQQLAAEALNNTTNYKGQQNVNWPQFVSRTRFEIKQVIFDPAFYILCGCTLLMLLMIIAEPKGMFATSYWPVTQSMVEQIRNAMGVLSVIIITYYTAEVVWRERESGMGDIIDSMPVLGFSFWLSKLLAVWLVLVLLLVLGMLLTIWYQLGHGYDQLEISQYLISLFYFTALPWMMKAVLAFFFQVISPNKYVGMLAFVLFIMSDFVMESLGLGHNMFRFSHSPAMTYSDMNGYGVSLLSHSWYMLYWGALSLAIGIVGYALWQRGPQQALMPRLKTLGYQLGHRSKLTLAASSVVFVFSASVIVYNTRVLNEYHTVAQTNQLHADYELRYGQYAGAPVPTMTKLNAAVDIFPQQRKLTIDAQLEVTNKTDQPIKRFLISMPGYNPVLVNNPGYSPIDFNVEIEGGTFGPVDGALNTHWFEFDQPLLPGEQRKGRYTNQLHQQGFTDKPATIQIIGNGTFIQNAETFPRFGYRPNEQLLDPAQRKKRGLAATPRGHKLEDSSHYQQSISETMLGLSSGYLEFETTVSTVSDQIAIAPGYLQKEWIEDNRRYFHYKMDAPIENYFTWLSGRYDTLKTHHNGVDISIYHHPAHNMNIERMQQAVKDSIDYYSNSFGPYQHRQSRIIEMPGPRVFAQDFPNTVAFSERSGFITNLSDPNGIDPLYYTTAHEIAHQWWGGQVDAANVQGGTMLVETLAQYSSMMLVKKTSGDTKLRAMLKLDLDSYLTGRARETIAELPLMRVEDQPYIHYKKGALAMMALADLLGETRLNQALKDFVTQYKFSQTGYPTTLDLMAFINRDTNEQEKVAIQRLFGEINLYDLKTEKVTVSETNDNRYEVTLTINAQRVTADGKGVETPAPLSAMIDIGLFATDPNDLSVNAQPLYLQKHLLVSGENVIKVIVADKPLFAGVDPLVRFIDRDVGDNLVGL